MRADFPAEPASAGRARRFVDATLRTWSCDALLDVATLLVSELVANAVLHARTTIGVTVRRDDERIRVEVHDGDSRAPAQKQYSAMATTGRGLLLVQRLSADWGVDMGEGGKSVWFELDESDGGTPGGVGHLDFEIDLDALEDLEPNAPPDAPASGSGPPGGGGRGLALRNRRRPAGS